MNIKLVLDSLMISKKSRLTECRRHLNDNIKTVTTETGLRKMIEYLHSVDTELSEINYLIVEFEKKK